MKNEVSALTITEAIEVGSLKIGVTKDLKAEVVKYDSGELRVRYSILNSEVSYTTHKIPKEHSKTVWQKAQQQQK